MKILVDAHTFSVDHPTGVSLYIRNLLLALSRIDGKNEYTILFNAFRRGYSERIRAAFAGLGGNFQMEFSRFPSTMNRRLRDWLWYDLYLPHQVCRCRPDVLFCPDFIAPTRVAVPVVVTVHDLCPILYPEFSERAVWYAPRRQIGTSIAKAKFAMADSECVRRDIIRLFGAAREKIVTVHLAADPRFQQPPVLEAREGIARKYGIQRPFALCVGSPNPRKNIRRLVAAFGLARREGGVEHELVIAGPYTESACNRQEGVRAIGYVPDDDLAALYHAADFFLFLSRYEGFGIPLVEAMSCGAPVITSDRGTMKEIAGDAALLVDPCAVRAIADGIIRLANDAPLRENLETKGLKQAKLFSWDTAAAETLAVFEKAAR
ncbi:MAG: glycosyltransferase family 1 protein [Planctomycetota bacterium]